MHEDDIYGARPDNSSRITLGLLNMVEADSNLSQRAIARNLGIALGLTNTYLKRCIGKGLIKVSQIKANGLAYYLTPKGFAEKSRLTAEYFSQSFNLFRRARTDYSNIFSICDTHDMYRVALYGVSDLTEIAIISARGGDFDVAITGLQQPSITDRLGLSVVDWAQVSADDFDAVVICEMLVSERMRDDLKAKFSERHIFAPGFLKAGIGRSV